MGRISLKIGQRALETPLNEGNGAMTHSWSDEQLAIFAWFKEPSAQRNLVVRARAGTGKTTVLIEGINRAPEKRILLTAFNKIIAEELQRRLRNPRAEAKTLHALGFSYVRQAWPTLRVDNRRKWTLAKQVCPSRVPQKVLGRIAELHTKARELQPAIAKMERAAAVERLCELALEYELTLPNTDDDDGGEYTRRQYTDYDVAEWAHDAMVAAMERTDTIDFADMIFLPLVHGWVSPRYDLVVADECQDLSAAQLEIAQGACIKTGRIAVIGDDRQAVYAFRGADAGSLDRLKNTLKATELGLKTTYRCPKSVVALAAELVPDFVAAPTAPDGIVRNVIDAKDTLIRDAQPGDAVLSRTNAPLVPLCLALLRNGKVARIRGRDLSAGLRKLCEGIQRQGAKNMDDLYAALDEYTEREHAALQRRADKGELHPDAVHTALERLGDNVAVIRALADGLVGFDELYARFDTLFTGEDSSNAVLFSTTHRGKGLEWDRVWLLESTFRAKRRGDDNGSGWRSGTEEENIRYVAITRSKRELVWLQGEIE